MDKPLLPMPAKSSHARPIRLNVSFEPIDKERYRMAIKIVAEMLEIAKIRIQAMPGPKKEEPCKQAAIQKVA